jgi:hypothetical protein
VKLWRRREREQPVQPDPELEHRIADVLHRYGTYRGRDSVLYAYKAEARQRQQRRAGNRNHPQPDRRSPVFLETPAAATPQIAAENSESVPSVAPAEGPAAKTEDEWAYEHFLAFEKLCGNANRIAERLEEARSYEPEDPLPDYVW